MPGGTGDTWLVNLVTGQVSHITSGAEADILEGTGWKAFATQAEADAFAAENPAEQAAGLVSGPAETFGKSVLQGLLPHWTSAQLRGYALRGLKIIVGIGLILIGLRHLVRLPDAIPVPVPA
jgi:hypothetical protein